MSLSASPEVLDLCKQVVQTAQPVIEAVTSVHVPNSEILNYVAYAFLAGAVFSSVLHIVIGFVTDCLDGRKAVSHD